MGIVRPANILPALVPSRPFRRRTASIVDKQASDTVALRQPVRPSRFVHSRPQDAKKIVNKPQSFFHLHLISDATGETLLAAGRAASAQYKDARAIEHIYPLIRTDKQLMKVFEDIEEEPGIILYTVVDQALARHIDERCAAVSAPSTSSMPIIFVASMR